MNTQNNYPARETPSVGLRFTLLHADGRREILTVEAERALIGSAAHCEVRLEPAFAAPEHLEVTAQGGVVMVTTRGGPPPMIDGAVCPMGVLRAGGHLALGPVRMTVELIDTRPPKQRSLWPVFAAIPLVLTVFAFAVMRSAGVNVDPPIPEAPALFPEAPPPTCAPVSAEQRLVLADDTLRVAVAKRERSPFVPRDGVEAVHAFQSAAACFKEVDHAADADAATRDAASLQARLEADYRLGRVRLEHAYRVHNAAAAKRELRVLIPLLSGRDVAYTEWLRALDRAVTAKLAEQGRLL